MAIITLTSSEWTIEDMRACWADDGTSATEAERRAEAECAYLNAKIVETLPGWTFNPAAGTFAGPARQDAIERIMGLVTEAVDAVIDDFEAEQS